MFLKTPSCRYCMCQYQRSLSRIDTGLVPPYIFTDNVSMSTGGGIEKRKYPRRSFKAKVGVLIQGQYMIETSGELGERGMLFETSMALRSLENMVISFSIPGGHVVVTRAQVRYQIKKGNVAKVGVEFTNITFEDRRKVRDFIAQRKEDVPMTKLESRLAALIKNNES